MGLKFLNIILIAIFYLYCANCNNQEKPKLSDSTKAKGTNSFNKLRNIHIC